MSIANLRAAAVNATKALADLKRQGEETTEAVERFSKQQLDTLKEISEQFNAGFGLDMKKKVELLFALLAELERLSDGTDPGKFARVQEMLDRLNALFQTYGGEAGKNFDWRNYTPNTRGAREPAKKNVPPRGDGSGGNKSPVKTGLPPGPTVISMPNSSGGTSTGNIP